MQNIDTRASEPPAKLTMENYSHSVLVFRDRQAGVTEIYDPGAESYSYNAYCLEKKLVKELYTEEFEFLTDAINKINIEFGSWDLQDFDQSGCGSCAAKK